MQRGQHIGKLVVEMPDDFSVLSPHDQRETTRFDPAASYVLVGGLGGIGRAIARWMVEQGAAHLIFVSRTAGMKNEHHQFFDELQAMGCKTQAVAGDIADENVTQHLVKEAKQPIKGVVQASMVLKVCCHAMISISFED